MNKLLNEQKNLTIYKKLLQVLSAWCDNVPGTGMNNWLDKIIEKGVSSVPSDKRARAILDYVLTEYEVPSAVQFLCNWNFSDLPVDLKPIYKAGNKHLCAFWQVDKMNEYKVKTLINVAGKAGKWVDQDGKKVTLIDLHEESETV